MIIGLTGRNAAGKGTVADWLVALLEAGALPVTARLHEGKVLGLAAFGEPVHAATMTANYKLLPNGEIRALRGMKEIAAQMHSGQ